MRVPSLDTTWQPTQLFPVFPLKFENQYAQDASPTLARAIPLSVVTKK